MTGNEEVKSGKLSDFLSRVINRRFIFIPREWVSPLNWVDDTVDGSKVPIYRAKGRKYVFCIVVFSNEVDLNVYDKFEEPLYGLVVATVEQAKHLAGCMDSTR